MTTETTELVAGGVSPATATFRAFIGSWNVGFTVGADATDADLDAVLSRAGYIIRALKAKDCQPAYGFAGPQGQGNGHGAATAPTTAAAAAAGQGGSGGAGPPIDAEWYTIGPDKPGKERLAFWKTGRTYAEISVVRTTGMGFGSLLDGIAPHGYGEHKIPVRVFWSWGNARPAREDGKDPGRFQDVTRVELIPPA